MLCLPTSVLILRSVRQVIQVKFMTSTDLFVFFTTFSHKRDEKVVTWWHNGSTRRRSRVSLCWHPFTWTLLFLIFHFNDFQRFFGGYFWKLRLPTYLVLSPSFGTNFYESRFKPNTQSTWVMIMMLLTPSGLFYAFAQNYPSRCGR